MADDYYITIYVDDEKMSKLGGAGLADLVEEVQGKKAIQVPFTKKDHKKLTKSFPDLTFDDSNACVLPGESENTLFKMIVDMKTIDVMKVFIMKAFSPVAGKEIRSRVH